MLKESLEIEYKSAKKGLPDDIWETYSSFSNTVGGQIFLGIGEKEGEFIIEGINDTQSIIDDFWNTITSKEKVNQNILNDNNIKVVKLEDKNVIVITVPEAEYRLKPISVKIRKRWIAYKRLGTGDREATKEQLQYMHANSQSDLDSSIIEGYDLDDLNLDDVKMYQEEVYKNSGEERIKQLSTENFLKEIGVLKRKRPTKDYGLTIGGLLFFGKYQSIRDYYPGFQLDYFKKESSMETNWLDRVSSGDMTYPEINIYSFYKLVFNKLTMNISEPFMLDNDSKRKPYRNDLKIALRENLVNMLMHAYYGTQTPLKVNEYPDYIEFYNPGDMRILPTDFIVGGSSKVRNSTLAVLFRRVGISEKAGSGGPRIFDIVNKYNLRIPDIISTDEDTRIRLWKIDLISSYKDLSSEEYQIFEFLISEKLITKSDAIKKIKMTEYAFNQTIQKLLEKDIIDRKSGGRSTHYVLKTSSEASVFSDKKQIRYLEDKMKINRRK